MSNLHFVFITKILLRYLLDGHAGALLGQAPHFQNKTFNDHEIIFEIASAHTGYK